MEGGESTQRFQHTRPRRKGICGVIHREPAHKYCHNCLQKWAQSETLNCTNGLFTPLRALSMELVKLQSVEGEVWLSKVHLFPPPRRYKFQSGTHSIGQQNQSPSSSNASEFEQAIKPLHWRRRQTKNRNSSGVTQKVYYVSESERLSWP